MITVFLLSLLILVQYIFALTLPENDAIEKQDYSLFRMPLTYNDQQQYRARRPPYYKNNNKYNDKLKSPIALVRSHSYYSIDIQIGTPPQLIPVVLDTGSADLWVPGAECPSSVCQSKEFDENISSTFVKIQDNFEIHYTIRYASGYLAQDIITVNDATVKVQEFGYVADIINITGTIGTLGLGFPSLAESYKGYSPFFYSLIQQKSIQKHVFSIYLHGSGQTAGEIIFGGVDDTKHNGDLTFMALTKTTPSQRGGSSNKAADYGFWQVAGLGVGVVKTNDYGVDKTYFDTGDYNRNSRNEQLLDYEFDSSDGEINFNFDTGTTLTYFSYNLTEQIVKAAFQPEDAYYNEKMDEYKVSCQKPYYSNVTIQFKMSPGPNSLNNSPVILNIPLSELIRPKNADSADAATRCNFGIAPQELEYQAIFIGLSALRSLYTVYNVENAQIGIAGVKGSDAYISRGKITRRPESLSRGSIKNNIDRY